MGFLGAARCCSICARSSLPGLEVEEVCHLQVTDRTIKARCWRVSQSWRWSGSALADPPAVIPGRPRRRHFTRVQESASCPELARVSWRPSSSWAGVSNSWRRGPLVAHSVNPFLSSSLDPPGCEQHKQQHLMFPPSFHFRTADSALNDDGSQLEDQAKVLDARWWSKRAGANLTIKANEQSHEQKR